MYILGWQFCKTEEISGIFSQYILHILAATKMFISIIVKEKLELITRSNEINERCNKHDNNNGSNNIDIVVLIIQCVIQDYDNIIDRFLKYWKYFVFYKLNHNKYIYTNNISEMDNNYAIKWNGDDIDQFIDDAPKYAVQNEHDGLMFFISSCRARDKVIYDSENNVHSVLLESYTETQPESNHLLSIPDPNIFFLDIDRGYQKAKVPKIKTTTMINEIKATKDIVIDEMKKDESFELCWKCSIILAQQKEKKEETFVLKGINKDCNKLVAHVANTQGFCKMGGSQEGDFFYEKCIYGV